MTERGGRLMGPHKEGGRREQEREAERLTTQKPQSRRRRLSHKGKLLKTEIDRQSNANSVTGL
jgi:hypothetical protein